MFGHIPVLLDEVLELLAPVDLGLMVDGTLGAGGHAEAILEAHPKAKLVGIDRDPMARDIAAKRLGRRAEILAGNFADLMPAEADAILLDVGLSSMQLADDTRGFSYAGAHPLDMRMDPQLELTAEQILNEWEEAEIARVLHEYGEMRGSRALAKKIVARRPIKTTADLPVSAQLFQALRIAVNGELENLERALPKAIDALRPGGRLLVITFHSLEDRIVKRIFREAARDWEDVEPFGRKKREPLAIDLTPKPRTASVEEVAANSRSRSAKLRAIEKCSVSSAASHASLSASMATSTATTS